MADEEAPPTRVQKDTDDAHRAIGRYVVEFSRLIWHMRRAIVRRLTHQDDPPFLAELALGEATGRNIADAFFAMCRTVADLDSAEETVAKRLQEAVNDEINRRNDLAHGDWWVGWAESPDAEMAPTLERVKPSRRAGFMKHEEIKAADLDAFSDDLASLRNLVGEFGDLCFQESMYNPLVRQPPRQVGDVLVVKGATKRGKGGYVAREGPHATGTVNYP